MKDINELRISVFEKQQRPQFQPTYRILFSFEMFFQTSFEWNSCLKKKKKKEQLRKLC